MKHYIDFAIGIRDSVYVDLRGMGGCRRGRRGPDDYGRPGRHYARDPGIDMPELVRYAKRRTSKFDYGPTGPQWTNNRTSPFRFLSNGVLRA